MQPPRGSWRDTLLSTKLFVPPLRPALVQRARLTQRLADAIAGRQRLVLISAPAGFGKTTLLSEWIAAHAPATAWLSLDAGDNDPARFLSYLCAALDAVQPGVGEAALDLLQSSQAPPPEAVLTGIVNQLTALSGPFALVLDDYHVISAQPIHDALAWLLEHLPPAMRLIIATRADPPLRLAQLRARDQLLEL